MVHLWEAATRAEVQKSTQHRSGYSADPCDLFQYISCGKSRGTLTSSLEEYRGTMLYLAGQEPAMIAQLGGLYCGCYAHRFRSVRFEALPC